MNYYFWISGHNSLAQKKGNLANLCPSFFFGSRSNTVMVIRPMLEPAAICAPSMVVKYRNCNCHRFLVVYCRRAGLWSTLRTANKSKLIFWDVPGIVWWPWIIIGNMLEMSNHVVGRNSTSTWRQISNRSEIAEIVLQGDIRRRRINKSFKSHEL